MNRLDNTRVLVTGGSGFIGTNLIDLLSYLGAEVSNVDIAPPFRDDHRPRWREGDIMNPDALGALVAEIDPHAIIHLAARVDTDSDEADDYTMNHVGLANLVAASRSAPSMNRFVFVSTQFVLGPGVPHLDDLTFGPHTTYGASKERGERDLRADPPDATWVIARPTNIWGPWHLRYQRQFWRVVAKGLYLHPEGKDPIRSYGYVGSVCLQLAAMLTAPAEAVHGRALYVGDPPIPQSLWVDAFSHALRGRRARRVPVRIVSALASIGEVIGRVGLPTPLDRSRFASMITDYPTPMAATGDALGELPTVPLDVGVAESVAWLEDGTSADVAGWVTGAVGS